MIDREIDRIDAQLAQMNKPVDFAVTMAELPEFVARRLRILGRSSGRTLLRPPGTCQAS
jgi:hypothetical protein